VSSSPLFYVFLGVLILALALLRAWLYKRQRLEGLFWFLGRVEVLVLSLLLGGLIFFGCLQIILRNFFHSGLLWADPLMRHLVLWLGCLGAALATTRVRHINIDVFTRLLPDALKKVRRAIVYSTTALAAFSLGIAALRLVVDERDFGEIAFGPFQTWALQTVLPFAFFLIAYRSLVNLFIAREARPTDGTLEPLPK
jgi:TRAP-type C4-dicarboxylate transport system permease small subunit